jgi:hypothetical protein
MIIVDITDQEDRIRETALERYHKIKRSGDQRMKDEHRFYRGILRSVATEVAAVEILNETEGIDLVWDSSDGPGRPDIIMGDYQIDVKHLNENTRNASIEYWESSLHKKQNWTLMVIEGQGVGWKFNLVGYYNYADLQHQPIHAASKVHTRPFWLLNEGELLLDLSDTRTSTVRQPNWG